MFRTNSLITLLLLLIQVSVIAQETGADDWYFYKEIVLPEHRNEYSGVFLDREIYSALNYNLNSIRIVDESDNFVPFYIDSLYSTSKISTASFASKRIGTDTQELTKVEYEQKNFNKEEVNIEGKVFKTIFDFQILPSEDMIYGNKLELEIEGDSYSKQVFIQGRNEKSEWTDIGSDTIYNFDGYSKTEIDLENRQNYNFYRITLYNNREHIDIKRLTLLYNREEIETDNFTSSENINYEISTENKNTLITIKNSDKLKLLNILIETEGIYKRNYSVKKIENGEDYNTFISGELYNFQFKNNHIQSNNIKLNGASENYRELKIMIRNEDNPPIKITNIKAEYLIDKIVFRTESNKKYRLLYGNETTSRPDYDIEEFKQYITEDDISNAELREQITLKERSETEKKELPLQLIFNILITLIALILLVVILLKLKPGKR